MKKLILTLAILFITTHSYAEIQKKTIRTFRKNSNGMVVLIVKTKVYDIKNNVWVLADKVRTDTNLTVQEFTDLLNVQKTDLDTQITDSNIAE